MSSDRPARDILQLRLYIAGAAPNSVRAHANVRAMLDELLPGRYELEIVDVLENPARALVDAVFVTPTLIKLGRPPVRIVGDLSDRVELWQALELDAYREPSPNEE